MILVREFVIPHRGHLTRSAKLLPPHASTRLQQALSSMQTAYGYIMTQGLIVLT